MTEAKAAELEHSISNDADDLSDMFHRVMSLEALRNLAQGASDAVAQAVKRQETIKSYFQKHRFSLANPKLTELSDFAEWQKRHMAFACLAEMSGPVLQYRIIRQENAISVIMDLLLASTRMLRQLFHFVSIFDPAGALDTFMPTEVQALIQGIASARKAIDNVKLDREVRTACLWKLVSESLADSSQMSGGIV